MRAGGVRWDQGSLYFCSEWSWAWTWYCWEEAGDDEGNEAKYRETEEEANPSTVSKTKSTNEQIVDDIASEQEPMWPNV